MIDRIEEIRARCEEGRPIRRVDVKELLDQIHDRDVTISRLQREVSRIAIESVKRDKTLAKLEAEVLRMCAEPRKGKLRELTEVQK